jgi:hypothetical protein
MEDPVFKKQKKAFKDIAPVKDEISELTEDEPKDLQDIKRRLSKKMGKD